MNTVVYDYRIFSQQEFGGISRYFCEIAKRIPQSSDWLTEVIAPLHCNHYLAESQITTIGRFAPLPHPLFKKLYALCNKIVTPTMMALNQHNVLHYTYYSPKPYKSRVPTVITVYDMIHELFPHYFPADDPTRQWKRRAVEAADHVICISHTTARDLIRFLDVPPTKISVVHLGYSEELKEPFAFAEKNQGSLNRPYFLYVGARSGYKNFNRLLEVFGASARIAENFDLVAFGGGPFTQTELGKINALGLRSDSVQHISGSDAKLARYYNGARAFIYPSEYEGFGIPPLEAMSCGCPVICSDTICIREIVGAAAEFFEPTNNDSIRVALERIAFDDQLRVDLVKAGRVQSSLYSWDKCAESTVDIYRALL